MAGDDDGHFDASEGTHAAEISQGGDQVRPDPARAAKVGATAAMVEAAMKDLAAGAVRPAEPEQAPLMLDEMDEQLALFSGPVRHVAEAIAGARGRGRPKGATNKNAFRDVLMRMGYRHPGLNLAALANADPAELARELSTEKLDAMNLILKANAELMPYFEGKAAQQLDVNVKALHVMVYEEVAGAVRDDDGVLDLTSFPNPE